MADYFTEDDVTRLKYKLAKEHWDWKDLQGVWKVSNRRILQFMLYPDKPMKPEEREMFEKFMDTPEP